MSPHMEIPCRLLFLELTIFSLYDEVKNRLIGNNVIKMERKIKITEIKT
ncbi:17375_t:CDS:2 [Rhizophagus irregularis]|nr:17375_t:CDS:2 [Rhizophagus irregularis]